MMHSRSISFNRAPVRSAPRVTKVSNYGASSRSSALKSTKSSNSSMAKRNFASEKSLKGTKTHQNLKDAFAGESQANRRYLYFANKADIEGYTDAANTFRSTADGETGHAHGHLYFLESVGDPVTNLPIGKTADNLKSAIEGETHEYTDMYPGFAKTAREEGFGEIADWFETLAMAEKSHAGKFQKVLKDLGN